MAFVAQTARANYETLRPLLRKTALRLLDLWPPMQDAPLLVAAMRILVAFDAAPPLIFSMSPGDPRVRRKAAGHREGSRATEPFRPVRGNLEAQISDPASRQKRALSQFQGGSGDNK